MNFQAETVVLKNKNFVQLWTSQALSQVTINIVTFLVLVRVFELTRSTIATSFVWIAYALPAIIIGPISAASADIFDKRKVLMISNLLQAVTVLLYSFFFAGNIYISYGVVFLYSFFNQFYIPTEASALPSLVKSREYPVANSIFFFTAQIAVVAGFGFAGAINQLVNYQTSFFAGSFMLVLAFVSVGSLPSMPAEVKISQQLEKNIGIFFERISEGYYFIKSNRFILLPFIILLAFQVSIAILGTILPVIATDILQVPASSSGFLIALPAGLGAGIGTFSVSRLLQRGVRKRSIIETFFFLLALEIWAVVFLLPFFGHQYRIITSWALFFLTGVSFGGVFLPAQTFLQEQTPGGMRGRVFGNFWFLGIVATVIPVLTSATIAEIFGVRALLFVLGTVSFGAFYYSIHATKNHGF